MRHADRVNALAYSPDGTRARVGLARRHGEDLGSRQRPRSRHLPRAPRPARRPDEERYSAAPTSSASPTSRSTRRKRSSRRSCGNQVHLWDPETGKPIKTLLNIGKTDKPLKALAYSPDGKFLAVGGDDGILRVVESDTGKAKYTSPSRNARIETVAYSPNGNMVALGDSNAQVAVYAPNQPNQLAMAVQGVDLGEVMGVAFTADSGAVFTCGRTGRPGSPPGRSRTARAPATPRRKLRDYRRPHRHGHVPRGRAQDGTFLVTGGEDKTVRVWDVTSGKQLRSFQGHMTQVTAVAARGDGKQIASASEDGAIRMWDLNTTDDHRALTDATDSLWAVAFSPDGKRVAAAGSDRSIRVYHPETGKLEATLTGATSPITSLAFFPDSNRLVGAGGDQGRGPLGRREAKGDQGTRRATSRRSCRVAVSDDAKLIVSGGAVGDRTVRGFRPEGDKAAWTWTGALGRLCGRGAEGKQARRGGARPTARSSRSTSRVRRRRRRDASPRTSPAWRASRTARTATGSRASAATASCASGPWPRTASLTPLVKFDGQAKASAPGTSPL